MDNHPNMKLYVEHIERVSLVNRMNITGLRSTNASLLMLLMLSSNFVRNINGRCLNVSYSAKKNHTGTYLKSFKTLVSAMQKYQLILPVLLTMNFVLVVIL